ncbi:homeobox protein 5 isoform X2 [Drosophila novamexicana]|uniref:homeobox protein 5 isoform X2 n=2 Tax=Drosophila novamexicana TaxID=47314 RepID=UPI0011E5DE45|nr:homeobox protein 5 isoform X2 [Drosophila novamexicana]
MTPTTVHNGSGSGSVSGSGSGSGSASGIVNLRSPNSYASFDNEDSLKEFDMARIHTSTPQYQSITKNSNNNHNNNSNNNNSNSNNNNNSSTYGSSGAGNNNNNSNSNNTPQKQKHPNNVPYDPFVHTNNKPPYSFSSLIFMAIEDSNEKALPVKEIYAWIVQHFPYFKSAPNGWKNSVRHNLSLNKSFVKVEKAPNMGKGSLWRVEPQQRQNLMQALNRSPYFPNSAVDKISPMLKSPNGNGAASVGIVSYDSLDGNANVPPAPTTPAKPNGLLANGNGGSQPATPNGSTGAAASASAGSHARFDPKLFPNLSKAFRNIEEPSLQPQFLGDALDEDVPSDYVTNNNNNSNNNNNNNNNNNSNKYNYAVANGTGNGTGSQSAVPVCAYNFERLARDCGADSIDDVHAAAAMLFLKHGSKAFSETFQNGAPVITSSPSEDHTYSAGGNSNADSGASTPLTNGNGQAVQQTQASVGHGADSNCASSDAAYDSSEENHNITPEELADQQRHRDGVDALLSLSRSSIVECGSSTTTTHYHSNGSSGSSHGSPHKRASSRSIEEEKWQHMELQYQHQQPHHHHHPHQHHHHQQQQQQQQNTGVYTNGSGSKMALLSSAAANVAAAGALVQQQLQQRPLYEELYSANVTGSNSVSNLYMPAVSCLPAGGVATAGNGQSMLSLSAVATKSKVKPLRGLRTKIKRKAAWMR